MLVPITTRSIQPHTINTPDTLSCLENRFTLQNAISNVAYLQRVLLFIMLHLTHICTRAKSL